MATKKRMIITPEAVASFPFLKEARPPMDGKGKSKFSISLVFLPGTNLSAMTDMAMEALKEKFGKDAERQVAGGKLHWPFRNGELDIEEKGYPVGSCFVNVNNEKQPGVVSLAPDPNTGKPLVLDPGFIYPGAIVRAALDCYCFDVGTKKGVTFGLRNLQFIRHGERLDGIKKAEDEFEADPSAVASLDQLTSEEGELSEIL